MNARIVDTLGARASTVGAALLLASVLSSAPVWAESAVPPPPPGAPPPAAAPDPARTVPEKVAPLTQNTPAIAGRAPDSPAIVVPVPIDPGIKVQPKTLPHDNMPVITPPATPSGDSGVIAK